METFSAESFAATLALLGIVIMVSALLSGLPDRRLERLAIRGIAHRNETG
jgi:hypothetical protein